MYIKMVNHGLIRQNLACTSFWRKEDLFKSPPLAITYSTHNYTRNDVILFHSWIQNVEYIIIPCRKSLNYLNHSM